MRTQIVTHTCTVRLGKDDLSSDEEPMRVLFPLVEVGEVASASYGITDSVGKRGWEGKEVMKRGT